MTSDMVVRRDVERLIGLEPGVASGYRWISLRRSSMLVPTNAPRVMAAALLRRSAHSSRASIVLRRALSRVVWCIGGVEPDRRRTPNGSSRVTDWISDQLGRSDLHVVAICGPPRPNAKPVLQVVTRDGTTVAWAKIGAAPLTDRLVKHEYEVLSELAGLTGAWLTTPEPIASACIEDRIVALSSALPVWSGARHNGRPAVARLAIEIAATGSVSESTVERSEYVERLADRARNIEDAHTRAVVTAVIDRMVADFGGLRLWCGRWHGDLSPWNLDWQRDRVLVWDWERSTECAPVGLDALHYASNRMSGAGVGVALRRTAMSVAQDVGQDAAPILELAYQLELFLRREEELRMIPSGADSAAVTTILSRLEQYR